MARQIYWIVGVILLGGIVFGGALGGSLDRWTGALDGEVVDGHEALEEARITVYMTSFNQRTTSISIDIIIEIRGYDGLHYEDPQLCLYHQDGTLLYDETLETISTTSGAYFANHTIRTTLDQSPKYILVDHPEFRGKSPIFTRILVWDSERAVWIPHRDGLDDIQNDFEYPRSDQPGMCG